MDTKKLRQKILDLAIRGKLVPQDPNDEPASVLLERIRAEKEQLIKEGKIKRSKKSAATDKSHYENVPFVIPESWCWVEMSDIFLLNPKNDINDNVDGGFIPMACVCDGYSGEHTFITKQWGDIKKGFSHFQNGDIGIAKISPCFENRKSVIFSDLPNNIGSGTTELVVLRGIIVNTAFYLLLIKSDWYISVGTKYFKGVVGQQRVHKDIFTTLQVPMPPLREQQKIVDSVKKWFSAIDEIENGATELETVIKQVKSKILDLAVSGKLVPQDPNDESAIELLKRINPAFEPCDNSHYENLPFEEPDGWCWATLGSIGKWQSGATPSRMRKDYYGGDIPWLKTGDLNDWYITDIPEYITQQALNETSVKLNPAGSILIAMYGATIGKIGILTMPATTNQACCACISHNGIEQMYLFYYLLSHKEEFVHQGGGGAQPNISKEKIVETLIPIPPLSEQLRIIKAIEAIFNQIDTITAELS